MHCIVCKLNVLTRTLRPTTTAKIRIQCCNAFTFPQFLSMGAKVPGNESSWDICSWGAKVPRGLVICELRTGEPVICELTCELGRWLDVTSHACHMRFAKYRTGFAVRIVSSAGLMNLISALLKAVAFVYLWLLFFGNCLCRLPKIGPCKLV